MATLKISDLPAGSSVASTDLFESSQGASSPYTSRRVTGDQVRTFVLGGPVALPAGVVNYVSVSGGALGTTPTLATTSSASDVGLRLQSKGQGRTALTNELGTLFSCGPNGAITPVNNILAIATATNSAPALVAEGSDTNIGLSFGTKGSGFMLLSMGAGGVLQLSPGGSEKMRVDASGNVGIGTAAPVNRLDVNGSIGRGAPVTKTSSFTLADTESWIICNGAGTITVTLPTASSWTGREVMIKTIAAQAVNSTSSNVAPIGSATAGTAILAATSGSWATLVSDGTNWIIMQRG